MLAEYHAVRHNLTKSRADLMHRSRAAARDGSAERERADINSQVDALNRQWPVVLARAGDDNVAWSFTASICYYPLHCSGG